MNKIDLSKAENYYEKLYREKIAEELDLDINDIPSLTGHRFSASFKSIYFHNINFTIKEKKYSIESPQIWIFEYSNGYSKKLTKTDMFNDYEKFNIDFHMNIEQIDINKEKQIDIELNEAINNHRKKRLMNKDKIWFHGTDSKFDKFDINYFGTNEAKGDYVGKSIYFAEDDFTASRYGDNIYEVKLDLKNPLVIDDDFDYDDFLKDVEISTNVPDSLRFNDKTAKKVTWLQYTTQDERAKYTQRKGYDGLLDLIYGQASVFSNKQIKIVKNPSIKNKLKF